MHPIPSFPAPGRCLGVVALLVSLTFPGAAAVFTVNTVVDEFNTPSGPTLSLREAVRDAAAVAGADVINFAPALSGQILALTGGEVVLDSAVTVDASGLAGGLTLDGNNASRLLRVPAGVQVVLTGLTLRRGLAGLGGGSGDGGGLANFGILTVNQCLFADNHTMQANGGGLFNLGTLVLNGCTFTGNQADGLIGGGGIFNSGTLTLNQCTVAGNDAGLFGFGGGIYNDGTATVNQSTITGNHADGPGFAGGGIHNFRNLHLFNSIVAGNTASMDPDIFGTYTTAGTNLTSGNPRLAPLGRNGGPTPTMPPLGGSPALDAGDPLYSGYGLTDQRGFPRVSGARVDLGAVESVLRGYYPFDALPPVDAVGGSTATYQGGASGPWSATDHRGRLAGAISLNVPGAGTDNRYLLTTPHDPTNANRGLGLKRDFTVSVWVHPVVTGGWKIVLGNTGTGGAGLLHLGLTNQNVHFGFGSTVLRGGKVIPVNQWTHLAWTFNTHGGQMGIWVNGLLDTSAVGRTNTAGDNQVLIGFCQTLANSYFQGHLDELAVYGEALSASQIAALAGATGIFPDELLPEPVLSPGLAWTGTGWRVREIRAHTGNPVSMPYDLPSALHVANTPGSGIVTNYTTPNINRVDPVPATCCPGPFQGSAVSFAGDTVGDTDYFILAARTTVEILAEDDYTFGFASDAGARLRVLGAVFAGSTGISAGNVASPAHRGDTLAWPGAATSSTTLGVVHLRPGNYEVEYIGFESTGAAYTQVFAARGAKTAVDGTFQLLSPSLFSQPPVLQVQRTNPNQIRVTWAPPSGVLESSASVSGPWVNTGATNGQVFNILPGRQFFRVAR